MSLGQQEIILSLKKSCIKYSRNLVDIATRAIVLVICTTILNIIVLYFYSILWHLYRLTYIGRQFVALHPQQAKMISAIVPTLCVFTYCFKFSERLLPEIADVVRAIFC